MKQNILVVEDTSSVREEICDILRMEGFSVSEAENGYQGLKIAGETRPELILTDIVMPEMGGFEFYKNILKSPLIQKIPVVFLSAKADKEALETAKKMGNGDYIVKPVDPDVLIDKIKSRIKIK